MLLKKAKELDIYPYFHQLNSKQGPEVIMEGKDMIMIGSNNYLGLTSHPEVIEAGIKALEQYGSGCSGSRFLNGTLTAHAGKRVIATGRVNMPDDWASSLVSPIMLANPTIENL